MVDRQSEEYPTFQTFPDATAGFHHAPTVPALGSDPTAGPPATAVPPVTMDAWLASPTLAPPEPNPMPHAAAMPRDAAAPPAIRPRTPPEQPGYQPHISPQPPAPQNFLYPPAPPLDPPRRKRWDPRKAGGAVAGTGLLAKAFLTVKTAGLLVLHFKTFASMLVSVAAYAWLWGWNFAIGFVLLMFVHELGHVYVLRKQGVAATAPMFIPFLGAFVSIKGPQRSVAAEATSALAGPAVGMAASGFVLLLADSYHSPLLRALAYTGFLLNLFNLIPALPLDGGRVAGAVHPAIWFGGLVAAGAYLIYLRSPFVIFLLLIGVPETVRRWKARRAGTDNAYMTIPTDVRWRIAGAYVAVAALCIVGMAVSYTPAHFSN